MNDELLIQIDRKIAEHFAEVSKLQAARKALSGSNGTNGTAPVAVKPAAPMKYDRTPLSDATKKRVLELTKDGGRTIPQIAKECGISEKSVVRIRAKARSRK